MKIKIVLSLCTLFFCFRSIGQATVTNGMTPQQYVENVLIGPGVQVLNVTFNDVAAYSGNAIGKFNYTGAQIAFSQGIVIGTGGVSNPAGIANGIIGPNGDGNYSLAGTGSTVTADPQLAGLVSNTLHDIGKLEFDFIPAGNTVKFDFIFGSDEYNEFVCSNFYDVFGFFVSGPNPAGGNYVNRNFALVPGTNLPISINTINNGSPGSSSGAIPIFNPLASCTAAGIANSQYFNGSPGSHFQMDGATKPITIEFQVTCGETYHFKFAIADVGDPAYDSWVFLQSGSFTSDAVSVTVATVTGNSTVIEGCTDASFIFTRPENQVADTLVVNYDVAGTATQGVDFNTMINPVTFLPGVDTVILVLTPIQDGITDGGETVAITVYMVNQCGDTIETQGIIEILDESIIDITENDPVVQCANNSIPLTAVASGGMAPYTYQWSHGQTGTQATGAIAIAGTVNYIVTATDQCGFHAQDTVTVTLNPPGSLTVTPNSPVVPCTADSALMTAAASGGQAPYTYTWNNGENGASVYGDIDPTTTNQYIVVATDACGAQGQTTVSITVTPSGPVIVTPNAPVVPCTSDSALMTATAGGGIAPYTYTWNNGDNGPSVYGDVDPLAPTNEYIVVATDACGTQGQTTVSITVTPPPPMVITETDPTIFCPNNSVPLSVTVSGGAAPYSYAWSTGSTTNSTTGSILTSGHVDYYINVTDICGYQQRDTVTLTLNQTLMIDAVTQVPTVSCAPTGSVAGTVSGASGTPSFTWSGPGRNSPNETNQSTFQNLASGWYYLEVTDDYCSTMDSIFVEAEPAPVASINADRINGCSPLNVIFSNNSQNANSYIWNFGNGQTGTINTQASQSSVFTSNSTIRLVAVRGICRDSAEIKITVINCGCTDPRAINFDPAALVDDGSCSFPLPTVIVPNVFTPDNDGTNNDFYLTTTYALNVEMWIYNRWGNLMFVGEGLNPMWDGRTNGNDAQEGTYFVKYIVTGYKTNLEGHGFLHLIRKN